MLFNRKITLYINDASVELEQIADLVCEQTGEWLASEEYGKFDQVCRCGNPNCMNAEVL